MTGKSDKSLKILQGALTLAPLHGTLEKRGFMRRFLLLVPILLAIAFTGSGIAQDGAVSVAGRAAAQGSFIRVVLNGNNLPVAKVSEADGTTVRVQFAKAIHFTGLEGGDTLSPAVSITKEGDDTLVIKTGALNRQRTLSLGDRLLVDLFTAQAPKQAEAAAKPAPAENAAKKETAPTPAEEAKPAPAAMPATSLVKEDAAPADKPLEAAPPLKDSGEPAAAAALPETAEAAPAAKLPAAQADKPKTAEAVKAAPEYKGSAIVTIGSTQGVALAAFIRQGYLWVVLSQESLSVPPLVSGPNAADVGPIDAVKIDGGSAYRMKLPEGAHVRPEGAGLVWRLYIEGKNPALKSVTVDRDFANTAEGPQVHIPMPNAISALRVPDPQMGDDLAVITVGRAEHRLINSDRYVDFDLLPAIVGAVIRPKADGIRIAVLPTEVVISRQGGLRLSAAGPRSARAAAAAAEAEPATDAAPASNAAPAPAPSGMYAFGTWALGGPSRYLDMRRSIDEKVASASEEGKVPELIAGAKFMLAQGLPQEANGFVQMALAYQPVLRESAEFQSINGAVEALMGDTDAALSAFATPGLENNDEINLWKAYALARAGKMGEAQKTAPKNAMVLVSQYPDRMQTLILPALIETQLARGDVALAQQMVEAYERASEMSFERDREYAAYYFRGRIAQLRGDTQGAIEYYRDAAAGLQGPYPVRATLALVERGLSAKTINREDAIRKLERFRYGWRGDQMESQMLQQLGMIYVTGGEQRRGLTILRDAASMASVDEDRQKLVSVMQKAFRELFSGKTRETMTPIESAAIAAEFAELMPAGGEGEAITMTIADQMVAVDLLDRAADMIEPMIERTETLDNAMRYAQRAAAIRILNDQPGEALKILNKVQGRPDAQAQKALSPADIKAIGLLRAKARAEMKQPDAALTELEALSEDAEVLRLIADVAWGAQRWSLAADAFGKLVKLSNLNATKPPSHEQAQLVLNQALALNLAGETEELEQLRLGYSDIMRRSDLAQPFSVVTRTAQEATLADRETLLKLVSEVNLFKQVLDTYKTSPAPEAPKTTAAGAKAPAAADKKTN